MANAHLTRINLDGNEYAFSTKWLDWVTERVAKDGIAAHLEEVEDLAADRVYEWATGDPNPASLDLGVLVEFVIARAEQVTDVRIPGERNS